MSVFVVIRDIVSCECCENESRVEAVAATAEAAFMIVEGLEASVVGKEGFYFYRVESFIVQGS